MAELHWLTWKVKVRNYSLGDLGCNFDARSVCSRDFWFLPSWEHTRPLYFSLHIPPLCHYWFLLMDLSVLRSAYCWNLTKAHGLILHQCIQSLAREFICSLQVRTERDRKGMCNKNALHKTIKHSYLGWHCDSIQSHRLCWPTVTDVGGNSDCVTMASNKRIQYKGKYKMRGGETRRI